MREESHKGIAELASSFSSAWRLPKCLLNSKDTRYLDNYATILPISNIPYFVERLLIL